MRGFTADPVAGNRRTSLRSIIRRSDKSRFTDSCFFHGKNILKIRNAIMVSTDFEKYKKIYVLKFCACVVSAESCYVILQPRVF